MYAEILSQRPRARGFTLIELMIAVVIVALLAAVAIPSYKDHLVKGRRAATQAFMMEVANKEKQYLLDARAYAAVADHAGFSTLGLSVPSDVSAYYTVTVTLTATPLGFTVRAVPVAGGPQASDGNLELTSDGAKTGTW